MLSSRQLFLNHVAQTSPFPLALEVHNAKGIYMFGSKNKKWIDIISGIGVSNVGHRHPKVIKAIQKQLKKYMHLMVYGEFIQTPQVLLATALSKTFPATLGESFLDKKNENYNADIAQNATYFVNSGSEAVEGAIKLAKRFTKRTQLIGCHNAYHGSTHAALSLGTSKEWKEPFLPLLPDIDHINFNEEAHLSKITEKTAAVIIETVQGEGGVRIPEKSYLQTLRKKCTETGTILICDEIQCGFGRTGKLWAFEHFDIIPDIVVAAKAMGGGMPIGAFMASQQMMACLSDNPILGHISTFGGHPVSCVASLATLKVIQEEKLLDSIEEKHELFKKLLSPKTTKAIKEFRGIGLMLAVEFESFEFLQKVIAHCLDLGLLSDWFLYCDNSMRIAPPLIITKKEIKKACKIILEAIQLTEENR
ncbi:ornithine/acetylornithine aminotransferase [Bernardetia litoralis DSM 6794]|uniref:Ornithine/acetylornithine aminotransferase n=1 Tax=Bernardetia litoralis (strain ATCC 23117 / DSM 6794 / NBRC 15988 / NCIMB 1366 / Fx l1 / Sio-4) TaxID=880071 RepID=I4AQU1_BERLS|nr:aspartate aminotransferase family protein [Bernardetia litoralis]AFM06326.1 ornithine/acetylornithine aminotransferase [Bernardetia litoralis DSM 6794]